MVVPTAHSYDVFVNQSIIEVRIEAWSLGRFSSLTSFYYKTAVSVFRKRYVHESYRQMKMFLLVIPFTLFPMCVRDTRKPVNLARFDVIIIRILSLTGY